MERPDSPHGEGESTRSPIDETTKIGVYALGGLVGGLLLARGVRMIGSLLRLGVQTVAPLLVTEILRKPAGGREATTDDGQPVRQSPPARQAEGDFAHLEVPEPAAPSPEPQAREELPPPSPAPTARSMTARAETPMVIAAPVPVPDVEDPILQPDEEAEALAGDTGADDSDAVWTAPDDDTAACDENDLAGDEFRDTDRHMVELASEPEEVAEEVAEAEHDVAGEEDPHEEARDFAEEESHGTAEVTFSDLFGVSRKGEEEAVSFLEVLEAGDDDLDALFSAAEVAEDGGAREDLLRFNLDGESAETDAVAEVAEAESAEVAEAGFDAELAGELEADAEAELEAVAKADFEAEVGAELDADAEAELEAAAEAELDAEFAGELEAEAETDSSVVAEADFDAEVEAEPEAEAEFEPVAAAEAELDAEFAGELEADAETDSAVVAEADFDAEVETEPEAEAEFEPAAAAEAELDAEIAGELESEVEEELEEAARADIEAVAEAESVVAAEADFEAGLETELGAAAEAESVAAAEAELEADIDAESELSYQAEIEAELETDVILASAASDEAEFDAELEAELEAEPVENELPEFGIYDPVDDDPAGEADATESTVLPFLPFGVLLAEPAENDADDADDGVAPASTDEDHEGEHPVESSQEAEVAQFHPQPAVPTDSPPPYSSSALQSARALRSANEETDTDGSDGGQEVQESPVVDPIQIFKRGAAALAEDSGVDTVSNYVQPAPAVKPVSVFGFAAAAAANDLDEDIEDDDATSDIVNFLTGDAAVEELDEPAMRARTILPEPRDRSGGGPVFSQAYTGALSGRVPVENPFAKGQEAGREQDVEAAPAESPLAGFQLAPAIEDRDEGLLVGEESEGGAGVIKKGIVGLGVFTLAAGSAYWAWGVLLTDGDDSSSQKPVAAQTSPRKPADLVSGDDVTPTPVAPVPGEGGELTDSTTDADPDGSGADAGDAADPETPAPVIDPATEPTEESLATGSPPDVSLTAEETMKAFLDAETWSERIRYIHRQHVGNSEFEAFYAERGDGPFDYDQVSQTASGKVPGTGFSTYLFTVKTEQMPAGFVVSVEDTEKGHRVDWHGFVQFAYGLFEEFAANQQAGPESFYVAAKRSHYFGSGIPGVESKICVRVISPGSGNMELYAFADEGSIAADQVKEVFRWGSTYRPVLKLEWDGAPGARFVRLKAVERMTWRARD